MNLRNSAVVLAALILAASCTSGTEGIFASIEREQKIVSLGGLSKTATVYSMAEFGGTYYATGGKALFTRAVTGTTWDKGTVAGNAEVRAVGATDAIYAVADGKLFKNTSLTSPWSQVAIPGGEAAYDLVPIRTGDGASSTELVLVTEASGQKNVVYRINGATLTAADLHTSVGENLGPTGVTSAVFDGTNYYLASESHLWQLNSSFVSVAKVSVTGPSTGYAGLLYLSSGILYLSTVSNGTIGGSVYSASTLGTSLTFTALTNGSEVKQGSSYPVSFGSFLANSNNSSVWVATGATVGQEGTGYMEITGTSLSQVPNTDSNNYTSSAIKTFHIGALFKGSSGYFLGTVAHGLWTWDPSKKIWSQQ